MRGKRLALRYGADPEWRNHRGELALGYACAWEQPEIVRYLRSRGAKHLEELEGPRSS